MVKFLFSIPDDCGCIICRAAEMIEGGDVQRDAEVMIQIVAGLQLYTNSEDRLVLLEELEPFVIPPSPRDRNPDRP